MALKENSTFEALEDSAFRIGSSLPKPNLATDRPTFSELTKIIEEQKRLAPPPVNLVANKKLSPSEEASIKQGNQRFGDVPKLDFYDKWKDIGSNPSQLVPFLSGGIEAINFGKLLGAAHRLEKNSETDNDLKMLKDYIDTANTDKTFGYKVMDVVSMMPSFVGEIWATGGIATAARVGAKKMLGKILTKETTSIIKKKIAKKGIGLTAEIIARSAQAPIAGATRIPAGTLEKQLHSTLRSITTDKKKENLALSATKAFGEQWVEMLSEFSGGLLTGLSKYAKNGLLKTALFASFQKANPGASPSVLAKIIKKTGWNGILGEMFEERMADVGHGLLYEVGAGDQKFKLPSAEQLAVEFVAFSVPGVAISALSRYGQDLKNIEKPVSGITIRKEGEVPTLAEAIKEKEEPKFKMAEEPLIEEAKKYDSVEEFIEAQGKPVYHGTDVKFDKFKKEYVGKNSPFAGKFKENYSFSTKKDLANDYSITNKINREIEKLEKAQEIKTQKLRNKKASENEIYKNYKKELLFKDGNYLKKLKNELRKKIQSTIMERFVLLNNPYIFNAKGTSWNKILPKVMKIAKEKGNDGLIIKNIIDSASKHSVFKSDIKVAFSSSQIKTKQQLIDIWNKAQEIKSEAFMLDREGQKEITGKQAVKNLDKLIDQFKLTGIDRQVAKVILTKDKEQAMASSFGSNVSFIEIVAEFAAHHELGHTIFRNLKNIKLFSNKGITREGLLTEMREKYPDQTNAELEETLMEDLELYLKMRQQNKPTTFTGKIKEFFDTVWEWLERTFGTKENLSQIRSFYKTMETGKAEETTAIKTIGKEKYIKGKEVVDFSKLKDISAKFKMKDVDKLKKRKKQLEEIIEDAEGITINEELELREINKQLSGVKTEEKPLAPKVKEIIKKDKALKAIKKNKPKKRLTAEELYELPKTQELMKEIADNKEEADAWHNDLHAKTKNYKQGVYYHAKSDTGAIGVGKGLYLGKDKNVLSEFYDRIIQKFKGSPNFIDLTLRDKLANYEKEAKQNFPKLKGEGEALKKKVIEDGYDGVRYYDALATGEEFVLYDTSKLKEIKPESQISKVKEVIKKDKALKTIKKIKPTTKAVSDKLIEQAKKYKSAEEFVKAQGKPVYHGTNYANARMIQREGINPKNANAIQKWMKGKKYSFFNENEKYAQSYGIQKGGGNTKSGRSFVLAIKSPKDIQIEQSTFKKGMKFPDLISQQKISPEDIYIKGIDNKWYPIKEFNFFMGEPNTFIGRNGLKELPIKTKSQLKDIWNKAQKIKPESQISKVKEVIKKEKKKKETAIKTIKEKFKVIKPSNLKVGNLVAIVNAKINKEGRVESIKKEDNKMVITLQDKKPLTIDTTDENLIITRDIEKRPPSLKQLTYKDKIVMPHLHPREVITSEKVLLDISMRNQARAARKATAVARKETREKFIKEIKEKKISVKAAKNKIYEYTKGLPNIIKAKLLGKMKNVDTLKDVDKQVVPYIKKLTENYLRKTTLQKINKLFDRIKYKKQSGRRVDKRYDADIQKVLIKASQASKITKEQAQELIDENLEKYKDKEMPLNVASDNRILSMYSGMKKMSLVELEAVYNTISEMELNGNLIASLKQFNIKTKDLAMQEKGIDKLTKEEGLAEGIESVGAKYKYEINGGIGGVIKLSKTEEGRKKLLEAFKRKFATKFKTMIAWTNIMDILDFNDKTTKPGEGHFATEFSLTKMKGDYDAGISVKNKEIGNMYRKAYGDMKDREMVKSMNNDLEVEFLGTFKTNINGKETPVDLNFSKSEARYIWAVMKDTSLKETFEKGMYYTTEMFKAVDIFLNEKDKAFATLQLKWYKDYYKRINKTYKELNGVDLPFNEFYIRIRRGDIAEETQDGFLDELSFRRSINKGSFKERKKNIKPIKTMSDITVMQTHIAEMEHYIAFGLINRKINATFGNEQVRNAIKQELDTDILELIDKFRDVIANTGKNNSKMFQRWDKLRARFVTGVLAVRPTIAIKQMISIVAYADSIPLKDFMKGFSEAIAHPMETYNFLKKHSKFFKHRGENTERDIKIANQLGQFTALRKNLTWINMLMLNVKGGDKFPLLFGGYSIYKYHYNNAIKAGKNIDEAVRIGIDKFETVSYETQQSSAVSDLSMWQQGSPLEKLFTTFLSSPNLYFRKVIGAIRNLSVGRGDKMQHAKTIAIYWFVLPILFQWVSDFGRWDEKEQKRAMLFGPLNGMFLIGDGLEFILREVMRLDMFNEKGEKKIAHFGQNEIYQTVFSDITKLINSSAKMVEDPDAEDVLKAIKDLSKVTGTATGLPFKYGFDLTQGMTDVIKGEHVKGVGKIAGWSDYIIAKKEEASKRKKIQKRIKERRKAILDL